MSKRGDFELLCDIREAMQRISDYVANVDYEQFLRDAKTQDAVTRNIEVMGEAVKNLSNDVKDKNQEIPWKKLAGVRDRLIHHYFGVNLDIVWNIIKKDFPGLAHYIEKAQRSLKKA